MLRRVAPIFFALCLSGCGAAPPLTDALQIKAIMERDLPTDYRAKIIDDLKWNAAMEKLRTGYSIKSGGISEPKAILSAAVVCVQLAGHGWLGSDGFSNRAFIFREKKISESKTNQYICPPETVYRPFSELEHID